MYSDNQKHASVSRANDAFLRRMLGGELMGGDVTVMNTEIPTLPEDGASFPSCNGDSADSTDRGECPLYLKAPSLAMVYAPRQCWRSLLDPRSALAQGTMFAEMVLPFEGSTVDSLRDREVRERK